VTTVTGLDGVAPTQQAVCKPSADATVCVHVGFDIISQFNDVVCPLNAPVLTSSTPISTPEVQNSVAAEAANHPAVSTLWTIVITLVERQSQTGVELVNVYVDLIGQATPQPADHVIICDIIKKATAPQVKKLPADLKCELGTVTGAKRDTQMMAIISYPSSTGSGATVLLNVAAALAAVLALFY
jgi:hypothetical protein